MTSQEDTSIVDTIRRCIILYKKIKKLATPNHIPSDYHSMKLMKERLEKEEQTRQEMNKMRESIKHLIKKKKQRAYWQKLERRRKIRKFLHLPYKTLNEDDFMKDLDGES